MIDWNKPVETRDGRPVQMLPSNPGAHRRRGFIGRKRGIHYQDGGEGVHGTVYLYDERGRCCQSREVPEDLVQP